MREVTYKEFIHAFAEGETIQFRDSNLDDMDWHNLEADNAEVLPYLMRTDGKTEARFKFRIKPKTVKIGNREIEAPLKSISPGEEVWYRSFDGGMYYCRFDEASRLDVQMFADGRFFSTKEAALVAHEAITALLTGNQ